MSQGRTAGSNSRTWLALTADERKSHAPRLLLEPNQVRAATAGGSSALWEHFLARCADRLEDLFERAVGVQAADQVTEERRVPAVVALVGRDPRDLQQRVRVRSGKLL